jgi:hypothetical protein
MSWKMEVDDPLHVYFLNPSPAQSDPMTIDDSVTLPIRGGSRVTFSTDSSQLKMSANVHTTVCANIMGLPQPYHGQFVHLTVESAVPSR